MARPETRVDELMDNKFVALIDTMDQEEAVEIFANTTARPCPVITENGVLVGIVTVDDILDVAEEEATEDIQKFGGVEALELPYVETPLLKMVRKRAVWLVVLFFGEMMTASAMGYYDKEIQKAVVLALFVPLIISSGGNSGSQAATLIIRAMSLKELNCKDWWYVMRRELFCGFRRSVVILGAIGFCVSSSGRNSVSLITPSIGFGRSDYFSVPDRHRYVGDAIGLDDPVPSKTFRA